ncbi:MAG TPA: hypothetical protein VFW23_03890 [Tepidisphaeraceae bacterium]|nr:hypothetical protein [Tepidisphaeraceae bacterium]
MHLIPRHPELPTLARQPLRFLSRYRYSLVILFVGAVLDALTTYLCGVLYAAAAMSNHFQWL